MSLSVSVCLLFVISTLCCPIGHNLPLSLFKYPYDFRVFYFSFYFIEAQFTRERENPDREAAKLPDCLAMSGGVR